MNAGDPSPLSILQSLREPALSKADRLNARVTSLYLTHRDGIYRFLVGHQLPPAIAQEVTQDVFIKLFVALRNGADVASEQGWLYGVAAKSAVDYWRREGRHTWVELSDSALPAEAFPSHDLTPEIRAARLEQLRRVAQAMAKLSQQQRLCIELRSRGLRYREIAGILGVSISTASEWLCLAVKRLRVSAHD